MTKTKKLVALMTAIGALSMGAYTATAADTPAKTDRATAKVAQPCPVHNEVIQNRFDRIEAFLSLKPEQKKLYDAYVAARLHNVGDCGATRMQARDYNTRQEALNARAERVQARADRVAKIAQTRQALWDALTPEQKVVFEDMEGQRRGPGMRMRGDCPMGMMGPGMGPGMGPDAQCPVGMGAGMGPGFHHRMMMNHPQVEFYVVR